MRMQRLVVGLACTLVMACGDDATGALGLGVDGGADSDGGEFGGRGGRGGGGRGGGGSGGSDQTGEVPDEGPACLVADTVLEISAASVDKVDMLFVVDNSGSMREEQTSLRDQFPRMIHALTTGDRDGDGVQDNPAATDLHLGVTSSDMGLVGITDIAKCEGSGDDGLLLHTPSPELMGCQASYPAFLTFTAGVNDPTSFANDFACIAALGTDGCGFEQQLEAGLKALWPSIDPMAVNGQNRILFLPDVNGFGALGHGDRENAGFLRNDPAMGLSVLAIIMVTDEEDCSSRDTSHFTPMHFLMPGDPLAMQDLNLRCFYNPQNLYAVERYINGWRALRPGNENLVVFAAIAGVPPDLTTPEAYAAVDWRDESERSAFYDRILDDPRMVERVDPTRTPGQGNLIPSCNSNRGVAFPPRRIVQVARGFGANGTVHSICQADLGAAIDGVIQTIGAQLGATCLPRRLVRDGSGVVGCDVVWELPPPGAGSPSAPTTCEAPGFPFLLPLDDGQSSVGAAGGQICRVQQLAVRDGEVQPTDGMVDGWYYDDFSQLVQDECPEGQPQRIAFSPGAKPPTGVSVRLQCLTERPSVSQVRTNIDPSFVQPSLGDPCLDVLRDGQLLSGDEACAVRLLRATDEWPDGIDRSMFCHPGTNTCALSCAADADCPEHFGCDDSAEQPYCAPMSCSAGPESADDLGVGKSCLPNIVPAEGFSDSAAYLETASPGCGGGVCLVYRLSGDPREGCIPTPPSPEGDPGRVCAHPQDVAQRVYCTCRCNAPEGFATCDCPDGFTCVDLLAQGGPDVRGGYCVREGAF